MAPSLLSTDGYKFSMAQAGFPLRQETFYFSFRKGGWQFIPFDLKAEVQAMLPDPSSLEVESSLKFLEASGYGLTPAMKEALASEVIVRSVPALSWVYEREPILTVTGPSFLVSWLEPHVLRLFYPIQLATALAQREFHAPPPDEEDPVAKMLRCSCDEQAEIARRVISAASNKRLGAFNDLIRVDSEGYRDWVRSRVKELLPITKSPTRIFEVGMRAATCEGEHRLALEVLREQGIRTTSNVGLACELGMQAVGTMGHEHVQRWGNDLDAYRAMRDTRNAAPSYLLDTFDTISSGIPSALRVMQERQHVCSIRYDSGDKFSQYVYAHSEFKRHGLEPTHVIEDGLTAEVTAKFERLRDHTELAAEKQVYGYGGFLVNGGWNPMSRDAVSAVFKLSETSGEPRMKFGNEEGLGKVSVPGHPVVWRRLRGNGPYSVIGQLNETPFEDYVVLNGNPNASELLKLCNVSPQSNSALRKGCAYQLSPESHHLVNTMKDKRNGRP